MFTERPASQSIVFVGNYSPGQHLKRSIADGDSVTLRIGEETVHVHNIARVGSDRFKGIVGGFEPSFGVAYKELQLDSEVEFKESHIFGCG